MTKIDVDPGSFRDREGRVFVRNGEVLRALSRTALEDWEALSRTAFFARATDRGMVVVTRRADLPADELKELSPTFVAALQHERIPFLSYPYEWSFGMLRDAALLHLDLLLEALEEDLILKDSSPYNVQWFGSRPVMIDIPSFQRWQPGEAWVGYRQFCQLFLYPLMITAYRNLPFQPWLRGAIDGITPEQCSNLLSGRHRLRRGVFPHAYLQSKLLAATARSTSNVRGELRKTGLGKPVVARNVHAVRKVVDGLRWNRRASEWSSYVCEHSYSRGDEDLKRSFVDRAAGTRHWNLVWDLGCNTGAYSRIAAQYSDVVVAMDGDQSAIESLYHELRAEGNEAILPLVVNLADPSPDLGWQGRERRSLKARGTPDLTLCLALIHHMVITANIPLDDFVDWLAGLESHLVIEFVTREDPMVERLLLTKEDIYHDYALENFERSAGRYFTTLARERFHDGTRVLYFLCPKQA